MVLEDVPDGLIADLVAEISEGASKSVGAIWPYDHNEA